MNLDDEAVEIYRRARACWNAGHERAATTHYAELRAKHSCDLYYEVELPKHFRLIHPVGTVLGRATYGEYFVAYQNVGVGSDLDGHKPVIGEGVVLFPGAKVMGNVVIGDNVFIQSNTVVAGSTVQLYIPGNSVVSAARTKGHESCQYAPTTRSVKAHYFPTN